MLTIGIESGRVSRQRISANILRNWRENCNGSIFNQILNIVFEGPTIGGIMSERVHMICAPGISVIIFGIGNLRGLGGT